MGAPEGRGRPAEEARVRPHQLRRPDRLVAAMTMVKRLGERAAKSSIPILITGESGVGKEVIARAVHGSSERSGKPFVAVNCGAIPENLVESILFGHEKGSFTGATDKHLGKFQEANGGTLFLDEVGELPLDIQVKLLRALQEGEIDAVGGKRPIKVDVRHRLGDQSRPVPGGQGRPLPRGPLLSPERLSDRGAGAARAQGGRPRPGRRLRQAVQRRGRKVRGRGDARDHGLSLRLRLAGQRPPVGERGLSRHRPGRRPLSAAPRFPGDLGRGAAADGRRKRFRPRCWPSPPWAGT